MDTVEQFEVFGDRAHFAIEVRHIPDATMDVEPETSTGSWGEWRLWVADVNLCAFRLASGDADIRLEEVRWFLAPLFKWLVHNWMPLLHEKRLPMGARLGGSRPRSARAAYLSMLETAGDDIDRFRHWQMWGERHSLRTAAEGGILPDVFFQRMEDDIEISWGDREQPGADAATFILEDGIARASVDRVAETLYSSIEWFLNKPEVQTSKWGKALSGEWSRIKSQPAGLTALSWYLDCSSEPKALTNTFVRALQGLQRTLDLPKKCWLGVLSPSVAMFGDLAPDVSDTAAARLLAEYFDARTHSGGSERLGELVSEEPAWSTSSPWDNGYSLALAVLDEVDPDTASAYTRLEDLLKDLGVCVKDVELGEQGPRGVAFAGEGLRPTILVNVESLNNLYQGRRFTLAHELCHILFDQSRARPLAHSSTPWASPTVEQRANAFAAMFLMPPYRARRPTTSDVRELKRAIVLMARRMRVSRGALKRHLSNINEIDPYELDYVMGVRSQEM